MNLKKATRVMGYGYIEMKGGFVETLADLGVSALLWNKCPLSIGMGVRNGLELVAGFAGIRTANAIWLRKTLNMKTRQILKDLWEASYPDNIGFEEMVEFYQQATDTQRNKMEKFCKEGDWDGFKRIIQEVSGATIKDETTI